VVILLLAAAALALGFAALRSERNARETLAARVGVADHRIAALTRQIASLDRRLSQDQKTHKLGIAPLANRVLQSVYSIETSIGIGTGWVAWKDGNRSYLITANHVIADALATGGAHRDRYPEVAPLERHHRSN
jgi:S1-C subfamily serine protease